MSKKFYLIFDFIILDEDILSNQFQDLKVIDESEEKPKPIKSSIFSKDKLSAAMKKPIDDDDD